MASIPLYLSLWLALAVLHAMVKGREGLLKTGLGFTLEPQDAIAVKGNPFWLNCSADTLDDSTRMRQSPTIFWHKNGQLLRDARHITVLRNGSLYFKRVLHKPKQNRSDEGFYQCLARNSIGTIVSRGAQLQVASKPRLSGDPQSVEAAVGEMVRFQCGSQAVPQPNYIWVHNKNPLPLDDTRYTRAFSGVLQINKVRESDAGQYKCRVANIAGSRQSKEATLTVIPGGISRAVRMLGGSQNLTSVKGDSVVLECAATGLPSPTITWRRLSNKTWALGGDATKGGRYRIIGQGNLEITNLQLSDSGTYVCSASGSGASVTISSHLNVFEPPFLPNPPQNEELKMASQVRMRCAFEGTPAPKVTWLKNGTVIRHKGRYKIYPEENMLVISALENLDSGYYQCFAENAAGSMQHVVRLYIGLQGNEPDPPTGLKARSLGSRSILLTWTQTPKKNGSEILAYSLHYAPTKGGPELQHVVKNTSRSVIENLKPYTNYSFYMVSYMNKGASVHSKTITQMTDEDVPIDAPTVQVISTSLGSIKVGWDPLPPERAQGVITQYKISYKKHGGHSINTEVAPASARELIILDLEPRTAYDVQVLARTRKGFPKDDLWPWVTATTDLLVGTPEAPIMQAEAIGPTAINVTWRPPRASTVEIEGYRLYYNKLKDTKKSIDLPAHFHNKVLSMLEAGTLYEIGLLAYNSKGEGKPVLQNVLTPPDYERMIDDIVPPGPTLTSPVAPVPPHGVEAERLNSTSIRVSWDASDAPSVKSYIVRYWTSADVDEDKKSKVNSSSVNQVESYGLHVVILNLQPYTMYTFAVKALSIENHDGQFGKEVQCRTEAGRPSEPWNVNCALMRSDVVELTWQPPIHKNGIINSYIVFYSGDKDLPEEEWLWKEENGTASTTRVEDLDFNTVYFFKLRATTLAGRGPPSKMVTVRTVASLAATTDSTKSKQRDSTIGIIVGLCISVCCVILTCIVISLVIYKLKRKYGRDRQPCGMPYQANHVMGNSVAANHYANGNSCVAVRGTLIKPSDNMLNIANDTMYEMDSFTPMLARVQENENSDSKGGYGMFGPNQHLNGVIPVNGLRATYLPNGQVATFLTQQNQTAPDEGPQVPLRSSSMQAQDNNEEEEEDLSSHDCSFDDTDQSANKDELEDSNTEASPLNPSAGGRRKQPVSDSVPQWGSRDTGNYNTWEPPESTAGAVVSGSQDCMTDPADQHPSRHSATSSSPELANSPSRAAAGYQPPHTNVASSQRRSPTSESGGDPPHENNQPPLATGTSTFCPQDSVQIHGCQQTADAADKQVLYQV